MSQKEGFELEDSLSLCLIILIPWSCLRWTRRPRCLGTIYCRGAIEMWYESLEIFGDAQCPRLKKKTYNWSVAYFTWRTKQKRSWTESGAKGQMGGGEGDPKINKETTTGFRLRHTSSTPRGGGQGTFVMVDKWAFLMPFSRKNGFLIIVKNAIKFQIMLFWHVFL